MANTLFRVGTSFLRPVLRPITRVLVGAIAVPIFRFLMRKVVRVKEIDSELEKDLEQWFRASFVLLAATANMEFLIFTRFFGWLPLEWDGEHKWVSIGLRLLLAIGVVESMPDQELFSVIHPGPPRIRPGKGMWRELIKKKWLILKGVVCQHLNRSSPVLAIMAAIFGSRIDDVYLTGLSEAEASKAWTDWTVGWCCYFLAITQYLIIGLITSRDKALSVLSEFDRAVAQRRQEIIDEFDLEDAVKAREDARSEPPAKSGEP